jgi:dihydroorotase
MPNLVPPITTAAAAVDYRSRVLAAVPSSRSAAFTPLMTCYLTDNTAPEEVLRAKEVRGVGSPPAKCRAAYCDACVKPLAGLGYLQVSRKPLGQFPMVA